MLGPIHTIICSKGHFAAPILKKSEALCISLVIGFHSFIFQICVSTSKQYREGKEFEKTKQVLGSGNSAGDIIIVKDKKTGKEHAQKTVSKNRPTTENNGT